MPKHQNNTKKNLQNMERLGIFLENQSDLIDKIEEIKQKFRKILLF